MALFFSLQLGQEIGSYISLSAPSKAHITQWETIPRDDGFALKATFTYPFQEKNYTSCFLFPPPYYLNEFSAIDAMKQKAKEPQIAWCNPSCPSQVALAKSFPFNRVIRTSICYGVLIYFFYLYKRSSHL